MSKAYKEHKVINLIIYSWWIRDLLRNNISQKEELYYKVLNGCLKIAIFIFLKL